MNGTRLGRPIEILMVDDNRGDIDLAIEALHESKVTNKLHGVETGMEALAFLRQAAGYSEAPRPDLILLDLNLPEMDGREVLAEIKADPKLQAIPVVILTTSAAEQDILRAYQFKANAYITKPVDLEQFIAIVRQIENFWFTIVQLPSR